MGLGPVPLGEGGGGDQPRGAGVERGEQVVREGAQFFGLGRRAGGHGGVGDGFGAAPEFVVACEADEVEVGVEGEVKGQVVGGVFEVGAGAGGLGVFQWGVEAVEGESFCWGAGPVVLADPGDQFAVGGQLSEAVGEAVGHHRVEGSGALLDVVVHGECGDAVGFEGDRAEAEADEWGEEFVADLSEGRFLVGGLTECQQFA